MIVNDLNAFRSILCPFEAEAILAIDADAVLSFAVTLQEFQMIIGWKTEVRQSDGRVQLIELPLRRPAETRRSRCSMSSVRTHASNPP